MISTLIIIIVNAGIRDIKFHDLRPTYATRLFELKEDPKTVQTLLGHSNISITLDTYTHVLESMKVKDATKLNDLYNYMGAKKRAKLFFRAKLKPYKLNVCKALLVRPAGVEPTTYRFEVCHSIQLSYGRKKLFKKIFSINTKDLIWSG
jgi:hypothetical protein